MRDSTAQADFPCAGRAQGPASEHTRPPESRCWYGAEAAWRRTLMRPRCAAYDVLKHAVEAGAEPPVPRDRPPPLSTSLAGERSRRWCWTAGQQTPRCAIDMQPSAAAGKRPGSTAHPGKRNHQSDADKIRPFLYVQLKTSVHAASMRTNEQQMPVAPMTAAAPV